MGGSFGRCDGVAGRCRGTGGDGTGRGGRAAGRSAPGRCRVGSRQAPRHRRRHEPVTVRRSARDEGTRQRVPRLDRPAGGPVRTGGGAGRCRSVAAAGRPDVRSGQVRLAATGATRGVAGGGSYRQDVATAPRGMHIRPATTSRGERCSPWEAMAGAWQQSRLTGSGRSPCETTSTMRTWTGYARATSAFDAGCALQRSTALLVQRYRAHPLGLAARHRSAVGAPHRERFSRAVRYPSV